MDAILSQEFVINLKSRAKSPTYLLDIVGHPHILKASSPDQLSPVRAVTAASIATTSTTIIVAVPSSSHRIFQHQESPPELLASLSPALVMPTPKMALPQTKQKMLLQSNNPCADKTLNEEEDNGQHPTGYSQGVEPLSRISRQHLPVSSAPNQPGKKN
ncbi:hypothetical protein BDC45DRAFT_572354 [Circinella umbellata]|nr:hypothetical protein BDC45DRAFT_572354 [Circinella umbellata]